MVESKEHNDFVTEPTKKISMRVYVLPNMMTTANLGFGFAAVILALQLKFNFAAYAIVAAAIFDTLDGRLARLTQSTSKFGAEYDSLSDLVSFGMAPAILLYQWALHPFGRLGWVACFLFLACGALRLARFNVQQGVIEKAYFQGLPIPMAAGIVASSVLAFQELQIEAYGNILLLSMTFWLAMVMVSTLRYRSFKDLDLKERLPFPYLVAGVVILAWVAYKPEVNLFLLFLSYATLGAIFGVLRYGKNKIRPSVYMPDKTNEDDLMEDEDQT